MHRAAHVQATGKCDAHTSRQGLRGEVLVELIHDRLDHARGVGCRRVAVDPALRMDDVADAVADAADHMAALLEVGDQGVHLALLGKELDVVTGRPAEVAAAELLGYVAHLADVVGAHEPGRCNTYGVELITGLGDVLHHALCGDFMIFPLPVVLCDHGRQEFMIIG